MEIKITAKHGGDYARIMKEKPENLLAILTTKGKAGLKIIRL